jgi:cysteine desulfurase
MTPVYMDNQSTTPVDPRVVEAVLPYLTEHYGNAGSVSHRFGWAARDAVERATESIANAIGARPREIVYTSGATESNNLAIFGVCERRRRKGNHVVSVRTEHKAVLDPLTRLTERSGFEVTLVDVEPQDGPCPGRIDLDQLRDAIRDDTVLVSVMMVNNEIGTIQPIVEIGRICREREVVFHCDAAQAVGKLAIDLEHLDIDLLSFSGHKIYGPRGIGALCVRRRPPQVRLEPQIVGGGQQLGLRSGTINVPGIIGLARALELCVEEMPTETTRLTKLRNDLFAGLSETLSDVALNGPELTDSALRMAGNLNMRFDFVDGEALMMSMGSLAVSSGSACTSANPEPSHVLRALRLSDDQVRSSLRFGLGRFTTAEEVEFAIREVTDAVQRLRKLSSMAQ